VGVAAVEQEIARTAASHGLEALARRTDAVVTLHRFGLMQRTLRRTAPRRSCR
jgi:hypothetical protein